MLELYGSLGIVAGIAQGIYVAMAFGLGGMLVVRGVGGGEWAERTLGAHLLLSLGVGYVLLSAGVASVELGAEIDPRLLTQLMGWGYGATILGLMATLHFTRRVFRPQARWAIVLACGATARMWMGWAGYGLDGGFARGRFEGAWLWLMLAGMLLTNVWVAFEPLHYWTGMRRRLRLGMADPIVTDRLLLWGCGSLARVVMVLVGPLSAALLRQVPESEQFTISASVLVLASACGLFTSAAYWLAFHPSARYARWTQLRASRLAS